MSAGPAHWSVIRADDGPYTLPQGALALIPIPRDLARCQKHLHHNQLVHLETVDAVQTRKDMAYHCQLQTAFKTLREVPETGVQDYNEFRKFCLVRTGWYVDRNHVFESEEIAASVRPAIAEHVSGFHLVIQDGNILTVRRAKSQKIGKAGEMTAEERYQSYSDVLDFASHLVGVTRPQLAIASENNA